MIFHYLQSQEDYLEAAMLQQANRYQKGGVYQLAFRACIACLVYLNLATLRQSFQRNDLFAYVPALAVFAALLVSFSPKLKGKLLSLLNQVLARPETSEERAFGLHEGYLAFHHEGSELRVGYDALARVSHNQRTVLFYLSNGVVESVPLRAICQGDWDYTQVLETIERRANKANKQDRPTTLPAWFEDTLPFVCRITPEAVLQSGRPSLRAQRRARWKEPMHWLSLLILLLCAVGGCYGLAHGSTIPPQLAPFLSVLYVLELPAAAIGLLVWYRPAAMVNLGLRQAIKANAYPRGYLGERIVEWNEDAVAFRYGAFGMRLQWANITRVCDDGQYLYFFEKDILSLFLPKAALPEAFCATVRNKQSTNLS